MWKMDCRIHGDTNNQHCTYIVCVLHHLDSCILYSRVGLALWTFSLQASSVHNSLNGDSLLRYLLQLNLWHGLSGLEDIKQR